VGGGRARGVGAGRRGRAAGAHALPLAIVRSALPRLLRSTLRSALRCAPLARLASRHSRNPPCHVTRRTFQRIVARQSTEDFAGAPYVVAAAQCATWVLYCLLTPGRVAPGVTNGLGLVIEARRAGSARASAFARRTCYRAAERAAADAARAERLLRALPALRPRRRQARRLHARAGRRCRRGAAFPSHRVSSHAAYAPAPPRALAAHARSLACALTCTCYVTAAASRAPFVGYSADALNIAM
jgi:hypothetical protein